MPSTTAVSKPCGSWRPIRSSACRPPTVQEKLCDAVSWWLLRTASSTPTRPRSRTSCCLPPVGGRRTARSPIPIDASRDSVPSCQCPAKPSRTGGSSVKSPAVSVTRQPSPSKPRTRFSWSTPPCPARTTLAGARSTSAALSSLSRQDYDRLSPIQWPIPFANHPGTERLLSDGRYFHPDGKARFVATPPRAPVNAPDEEFPLVLNTGRIRDQWHTMTRTGYAPRLTSHLPEPYVDMHAQDALLAGTRDGGLVRVVTRWGSIIVRLRISGEMPRGMIFVPIHWNGTFSSDARVGALVNPVVDPVSGEPEFKHTPARVLPFVVGWQGFVLARHHRAPGRDVVDVSARRPASALRNRRATRATRLVAVGTRAAQRSGRRGLGRILRSGRRRFSRCVADRRSDQRLHLSVTARGPAFAHVARRLCSRAIGSATRTVPAC